MIIIDHLAVKTDNCYCVVAYRIDSIAQLARELSYTPVEKSLLQVASAEDLLHEIDTTRAYPLDYVVFRITGYHPRVVAPDLLTGMALQHDLGLLIEQLSDRQQLVAANAGEPVLSIDDITEQFNITSKTVQRWRRRGLPARRFIFGDGKRRVGFLLSSVERFIRSNRNQVVDAGPNLSRIGTTEEQRIIAFARRLAIHGRCWPEEIARRIGKRIGRSPLTVLHTVRAFDQAHPSQAVLPLAAHPIGEPMRARILRRYRRGWSLSRLAARVGRPRSAIYRVILDQRIEAVSLRKTRFIDDPLYHEADAESSIEILVTAAAEALAEPRPTDSGGAFSSLCSTPLLSPARERALFLQLNFYRFQFVRARRQLDPQFADWRQLREMTSLLKKAAAVRNEILCANLRLVVSVARRHLWKGFAKSRPAESVSTTSVPPMSASSSLMDLVSDGSLTLMRAIDSFDTHRGNRFSTYATLSLMKGYARTSVAGSSAAIGCRMRSLEPAALDRLPNRSTATLERSGAKHDAEYFLAALSDSERKVVRSLFGIGSESNSTHEIASRLGVSPARVRQIEKGALAKMRSTASVRSIR